MRAWTVVLVVAWSLADVAMADADPRVPPPVQVAPVPVGAATPGSTLADLFEGLAAGLDPMARPLWQAQLALALIGPPHERAQALSPLLAAIDLDRARDRLAHALIEATGFTASLESSYPQYAPLVRDGAALLIAGLSDERLTRKLLDQVALPLDAPGHERMRTLLDRMPTLQKLCQVFARDRHLAPEFRAHMMELESGLRTETPAALRALLQERLGPELDRYQVVIADTVLAEGTIAAVIRFSYTDPDSGTSAQGVFKIVKPYVRAHMAEELAILQTVAAHFEQHHARYGLGRFAFSRLLGEVHGALDQELRIEQERAHLEEAGAYFADEAAIQVPRVLPFHDPDVLAMGFLRGVKVTTGCTGPDGSRDPACAASLARLITRTLIAGPLLAPSDRTTLFHADPHAGNLLAMQHHRPPDAGPDDDSATRLGLLDWGLLGHLRVDQRHHIAQLGVGLRLHDRGRLLRAIDGLVLEQIAADPQLTAAVRAVIDQVLAEEAPASDRRRLDGLLTEVLGAGLTLPADLLLFKKAAVTLDGVIEALAPGFDLDAYARAELTAAVRRELCQRLLRTLTIVGWNSHDYPSGLSNEDLKDLAVQALVRGVGRGLASLGRGVATVLWVPGWFAGKPSERGAPPGCSGTAAP